MNKVIISALCAILFSNLNSVGMDDKKYKEEAYRLIEELNNSHLTLSLKKAFEGQRPFYAITVTRMEDIREPLFLDEIQLVFACTKLLGGYDRRIVRQALLNCIEKIKEEYVKKFSIFMIA